MRKHPGDKVFEPSTPEQEQRAAEEASKMLLDMCRMVNMFDALRQWKYAEDNNDAEELANARKSRDAAIEQVKNAKP